MQDNDKISGYQVMALIFNSMMGAGIISLPAFVSEYAGNDGWLLVIFTGVVNAALLLLVWYAGSKCGEQGLFGTLSKAFGKIPAAILLLPLLVYILFYVGMETRSFSEVTKLFLLSRTPIQFILIPMILLAVVLVRAGIEPMCRFFEIVFPIITAVLLICALIASRDLDWSNLRPFFSAAPAMYLKGIIRGGFLFGGYQLLLIIFPFIKHPKGTLKHSFAGFGLVLLSYVAATMMCIAKFGATETSMQLYPTINLIKASEIPGAFVERTDAFILAVWLVSTFTTIVAMLYGFTVVAGNILDQRQCRHAAPLALPLIYIISLYGENVAETTLITQMNSLYLGNYAAIILPLLVIAAWLLKRKGVKCNEK